MANKMVRMPSSCGHLPRSNPRSNDGADPIGATSKSVRVIVSTHI